MKALIYKDIILSKKEYIATVFLYFIFAGLSKGDRGASQIPVSVLFAILLNSYRVAIWMMLSDLKSGFASFALSGVHSRREYVLSKYALIWIDTAIAVVYAWIMSFFLQLPTDVTYLLVLLSASIPLVSAALILPIAFFEGEHRQSILQMVGLSTLMILLFNYKKWIASLHQLFQSVSGFPWVPSMVLVGSVVAIHGAAVWVSVRAFSKREF